MVFRCFLRFLFFFIIICNFWLRLLWYWFRVFFLEKLFFRFCFICILNVVRCWFCWRCFIMLRRLFDIWERCEFIWFLVLLILFICLDSFCNFSCFWFFMILFRFFDKVFVFVVNFFRLYFNVLNFNVFLEVFIKLFLNFLKFWKFFVFVVFGVVDDVLF